MEQHIEYFDLAVNLVRAQAMSGRSETADIDRYNDECGARADMLEAAKDSDIDALADSYLDTKDAATAHSLVEWFIEEMIADGDVALIQRLQASGGFFSAVLKSAAKKMAEHRWNEKYGS